MAYQTARSRAYMFPLDHGRVHDAVEVRDSVEILARRVSKSRIALALETDRNHRQHFLRIGSLDRGTEELILDYVLPEYVPHVRGLLRTAKSVAKGGISVFPIDYNPENPKPLYDRIERAESKLVAISDFDELIGHMARTLALYNMTNNPREVRMANSVRQLSAKGYTAILVAVGYDHVLPISDRLSSQLDIRFLKRLSSDDDMIYTGRKAVAMARQTPEQNLAIVLSALSIILEYVIHKRLGRWPTAAELKHLASVDSLDQAREVFEELPRVRDKRGLDDVLRIV